MPVAFFFLGRRRNPDESGTGHFLQRVIYMPQEIDRHTTQSLLARVRSLPKEKLGQLMTIVSCLGSRPQRLLETQELSPGEIHKILLALGISQVPHMIIMDEPTNHLDLPSIKCLENALAECPCGVLLVSHDQYFLDHLTTIRWHIAADREGSRNTHMRLHITAKQESGQHYWIQ